MFDDVFLSAVFRYQRLAWEGATLLATWGDSRRMIWALGTSTCYLVLVAPVQRTAVPTDGAVDHEL